MATATKYSHEETQRRVQHPLQLVRKYIRRYVVLEGLALTLLFVSVIFWLGLAFDFGLYKFDIDLIGVHGIDWIQELNDVETTGVSSIVVRVIFMIVFVVALLALGFSKVVLRWMRDFNDRAIALVLERRFHKQLGDRLITAVELADPKLTKKYGFSQEMVEKTIGEAVETLKKLPVASVFNWRRLVGLWVLVGLSTVGVLVLTMIAFCVGSLAVHGEAMSPVGFAWRFSDAAAIWTERHVMMQESYWPRRTHLVIERFQPAKGKPNDMNVARDDSRPELQVRAVIWVVADRDRQEAPNGWRAMRWRDLNKLVDPALLSVAIPKDFPDWKPDTDELEPNHVAAIFADFAGKKSGEIRKHLAQPHVKKKIDDRGAQKDLDDWLDWTTWTVDKLHQQMEEADVRVPLRETGDYQKLDAIFAQLKELADAPSMSRTLRKLEAPSWVDVKFSGMEFVRDENGQELRRRDTGNKSTESVERVQGNKFTIPLANLKDADVFRFRARGDDFYTPKERFIVLVPAPAPSSITIDKEEPAYIYHRLPYRQDVIDDPLVKDKRVIVDDQTPLAGRKHTTKDFALPTAGDTNTIEVPFGANLVIRMRTDREMRKEKSLFTKDPPIIEPGFDTFKGSLQVDADLGGFSLTMNNLTRKHDFLVEYFDKDSIRGRRRFRVLTVTDTDPQLGNLSVLGYTPRRPKVKVTPVSDTQPSKERDPRDIKEQAELANSFLITPDALVPFECDVKDDYGLVRVGYYYKQRQVDFELVAQGAKKPPTLQINQATRVFFASAIASIFQYAPANPASWRMGAEYSVLMGDIIQRDLRQSQGYREAFIASDGFQDMRVNRERRMKKLVEIDNLLAAQRQPNGKLPPAMALEPWEFKFKDDPGFDVRRLQLKTVDPDKVAQFHYLLQVAVQASDNNVETGAYYRDDKGNLLRGNTKKNKNGYISFLVVSENELLSQIALEEETISEKLDVAKEKVDSNILLLKEQHKRLGDDNTDMDNVLIRMKDISSSLGAVGNTLRESTKAYQNIHKEMQVNNVHVSRINTIRTKIVEPLEDIVDANDGTLGKADDAFQKAHDVVEGDVTNKRKPNLKQHDQTVAAADRELKKLSDDIGRVLNAMNDGIVEAKLIAMLVTIEDMQRQRTRIFKRWLDEKIEDDIRKLLEGDGKDKKKPIDKEGLEKIKGGQTSAAPSALRSTAAIEAQWDRRIPALESRPNDRLFLNKQ